MLRLRHVLLPLLPPERAVRNGGRGRGGDRGRAGSGDTVRVQARLGIAAIIERDGRQSARLHAVNPPAEGEGAGDRICANVPLPDEAVIVTGLSLRGQVNVQVIRWRSEGWAPKVHRVVILEQDGERFTTPVAASAWAPGAWGGDSVLSKDFDPGLPPEANPA